MTPQAERVMEYMRYNGSITSLEAINELGITRLSAVIFNIKEAGWDIRDKFIKVKNRFDEECRVKQYWCVGRKKSWWEKFKEKMKGI
ncbi:MAG: hypothetical protein KBT03_09655 [Bacteroidales bacterium]|nr:hypothetical protein [Candidatus Scybalousia scybalohippi]